MSSSAINQGVLQAKISNVQNVGDSSAICSTTGDWSFKNATATATNVFISNAGNVGIGTTSPAVKLHATSAGGLTARVENTASVADSNVQVKNTAGSIYMGTDNIGGYLSIDSSRPFVCYTGGLERMRIDASGNLLVGATSTINLAKSLISFTNASNGLYLDETSNSSGTQYVRFSQSGVTTGSITRVTTTSAVNYNTSSDYRLKDNIQPMTNALERVAALKPVTYIWKESGTYGEGFIAHQLAEVLPQAVTGIKDEVDEHGNPIYQGIDASNLIGMLTAAIQELSAKVEEQSLRLEAQAAEIEALKAK